MRLEVSQKEALLLLSLLRFSDLEEAEILEEKLESLSPFSPFRSNEEAFSFFLA
jgi:hypothetical protein